MKAVVFSGTTEGRRFSKKLAELGVAVAVCAKQKNTNFAVCMTLPMVPCFQWSIYIKENSASIVPYILKCLFLFPKEDCICSLPEHT